MCVFALFLLGTGPNIIAYSWSLYTLVQTMSSTFIICNKIISLNEQSSEKSYINQMTRAKPEDFIFGLFNSVSCGYLENDE